MMNFFKGIFDFFFSNETDHDENNQIIEDIHLTTNFKRQE